MASFFAFAEPEVPKISKRSIYAWEWNGLRDVSNEVPILHRLGPNVSTHPRHAMQQADYSLCASFGRGVWRLRPHEEAFSQDVVASQDLFKFNIPSTERKKVLKFLDEFNLNAYALFGSEESLMNMLAVRAFDLGKFPARRR